MSPFKLAQAYGSNGPYIHLSPFYGLIEALWRSRGLHSGTVGIDLAESRTTIQKQATEIMGLFRCWSLQLDIFRMKVATSI